MFRIAKRFEFCAARRLLGLPEGHECGRLHGHNYEVEVIVEAVDLDERGFAQVDDAEFRPFKEWLDQELDHGVLLHRDDPIGVPRAEFSGQAIWHLPCNPTAENLAKWFLEVARARISPFVSEVRVSETPNTWASYKAPN